MRKFKIISICAFFSSTILTVNVSSAHEIKKFTGMEDVGKSWKPNLSSEEIKALEPVAREGLNSFSEFRLVNGKSLRGLKCTGSAVMRIISPQNDISLIPELNKEVPECEFGAWKFTSGIFDKEMKPKILGIKDKKISDGAFGIKIGAKINEAIYKKVGFSNTKLYIGSNLEQIIKERTKLGGINLEPGATVYFSGGEGGDATQVSLQALDPKRAVKFSSADCKEVNKASEKYISCQLSTDFKLKNIILPAGTLVLYSIPSSKDKPDPVYALGLKKDVLVGKESFKAGTSVMITEGKLSAGAPEDFEVTSD